MHVVSICKDLMGFKFVIYLLWIFICRFNPVFDLYTLPQTTQVLLWGRSGNESIYIYIYI